MSSAVTSHYRSAPFSPEGVQFLFMNANTPWPYPFWIAHRGAGKLAPENTLAAFRLGASHSYRMFECDAKLSADGVPFLLHDDTLERTSTGHGTGGDQPWGALAQLDAGSWHSRAYAGEPVLTLANVARYCLANQFCLNIEIKPTPGQRRPVRRSCRAGCCSTNGAVAVLMKLERWAAWRCFATTRSGTPPAWPTPKP